MNIYNEIVDSGVDRSSNEGDLLCKKTPESQAIVEKYEYGGGVTEFMSKIDGTPWYSIPCAFAPFWDKEHMVPVGLQGRV